MKRRDWEHEKAIAKGDSVRTDDPCRRRDRHRPRLLAAHSVTHVSTLRSVPGDTKHMNTQAAERKLNSALIRRAEARVAFERAKQRLEAAEKIADMAGEAYLKLIDRSESP